MANQKNTVKNMRYETAGEIIFGHEMNAIS